MKNNKYIKKGYSLASEVVWNYYKYKESPLTNIYDMKQVQEVKLSITGDTPWNL